MVAGDKTRGWEDRLKETGQLLGPIEKIKIKIDLHNSRASTGV